MVILMPPSSVLSPALLRVPVGLALRSGGKGVVQGVVRPGRVAAKSRVGGVGVGLRSVLGTFGEPPRWYFDRNRVTWPDFLLNFDGARDFSDVMGVKGLSLEPMPCGW